MILDIRDLEEEAVIERTVELPDLHGDQGGLLLVEPARLTGRAEPGGRGIDLIGRLHGVVELTCSRCLELFRQAVDADFELCVVRGPAGESGAEEDIRPGDHEMLLEDASVFRAPGGKLDLRTLAQEQILLNLPLKPVCRTDCAGLCPTCGVNRNGIECACRSTDADPRLAPLLDLKLRDLKPKNAESRDSQPDGPKRQGR